MGQLDQRGDIDIATIAVYIPILCLAAISLFRNGLKDGAGWVYLILFSIIKIAGAAISIDYEKTGNTGLEEPSAIINSIGLSPLMMSTLSMINPRKGSQFYNSFQQNVSKIARVDHLIIILALILGVVGGIDAYSTDFSKHHQGQDLMRAAAAMYFIGWLVLVIAVVLLWPERLNLEPAQKKIFPIAAVVVLPLLFVRTLYTALGSSEIDTDHSQTFVNSPLGSWVAYLLMAFIPEVTIALVYVITGVIAPRGKSS